MNASKKYAALVDRLMSRTAAGSLGWELQNGHPICSLGNYTVRLTSGRDSENVPFEYVELLDEYLNRLEMFSDGDLKGSPLPENEEYDNYYWKMADLRELAYRKAVGADAALDEVLRELGE